jgi:glycosyltransferase involved in cell wall biosynthesis
MKISIITATWNSGATLRDTLNSVLSQSYNEYEHIIVDGCSSDDTLEIIKEYEPRYNGRLKWISEKDRGLYDAMNKGILMATGDVIGILNSDDFYSSNKILKNIVDKFSDDIDAVYGDIHFVNTTNLKKTVRYYSASRFRAWKMRFGFMPPHPSFYCKRSIYEKYGGFDLSYKIAADFESIIRFIYKGGIIAKYIPMDFVTMRNGGTSTSGMKSYKINITERLRALKANNIYSNYIFLMFVYPSKYWQVLRVKFCNR